MVQDMEIWHDWAQVSLPLLTFPLSTLNSHYASVAQSSHPLTLAELELILLDNPSSGAQLTPFDFHSLESDNHVRLETDY